MSVFVGEGVCIQWLGLMAETDGILITYVAQEEGTWINSWVKKEG